MLHVINAIRPLKHPFFRRAKEKPIRVGSIGAASVVVAIVHVYETGIADYGELSMTNSAPHESTYRTAYSFDVRQIRV